MSAHLTKHPRHWASLDPERPAVIFAGSGVVIRYGELESRANRCAHLLRRLGLRRGDHVAILMENQPHFFEMVWASHNAGLYYTPISWRFHIDEIAFILADCAAQVLLCSQAQAGLLPILQQRLPALRCVVAGSVIGEASEYERALSDCPDKPIDTESRGSDMLYSSGSTGRPKGIKQTLPDAAIDKPSAMFQIYEQRFGWTPDTVYLMPAPLYHSGPLRFSMAMQHLGATLIVMERFDALQALEACVRYRVTDAHLVPTMLVRLLKLPESQRAGFDLSGLVRVVHGAGPIARETKQEAIAWLGPILEESYGGTEGNGMTLISTDEWLLHPGSVGRAFVGSIHILDEHGKERPVGETGIVYFSGGPRFQYHNDPERTRDAYDAQGRSTLGDIGYLDTAGYLYLTDRRNNLVITGGVNVFPQEIENVLITHPEVMDVAVFGVPDVEMGERLVAVVQPRDPAAAGPALAAELQQWVRSRLAGYKIPRRVDFRGELPRHDTGKIYTRLLKAEYLAAAG